MTTLSTSVNSVGLALDILGVLLVWCYGIPAEVSRSGVVYVVTSHPSDSDIAKAKRFDRFATAAIALLVLGFGLQLVSNFL
jgi:hypothetical protein